MNYNGLIVGLGNPGSKYTSTRHNIGFMVVDRFLDYSSACMQIKNSEHKKNVKKLCQKYSFQQDQIIVVHDELDLAYGKLRFKYGGGLSGHNGLASISEQIGSKDFYRLRVGIDRPAAGRDVIKHVLSKFTSEELNSLSQVLTRAASGLYLFCTQGLQTAMNQIH